MYYCIICAQSLLFFPNEKTSKVQSSGHKNKGIKAKLAGIIGSKNGDVDEGGAEGGKSAGFSPYASSSFSSSSSRSFTLGSKKNTVKNLMGFSNSGSEDDDDDDSKNLSGDFLEAKNDELRGGQGVSNEHNVLDDQKGGNEATNHQAIHHFHPLFLALAEKAFDYTKRSHVFRFCTADLSQYLIQTRSVLCDSVVWCGVV